MSYTTQDLRCAKCFCAASSLLTEYCECSGSFALSVTPEFVKQRLEAYQGVASFYGFTWLEQELNNYIAIPSTDQVAA